MGVLGKKGWHHFDCVLIAVFGDQINPETLLFEAFYVPISIKKIYYAAKYCFPTLPMRVFPCGRYVKDFMTEL